MKMSRRRQQLFLALLLAAPVAAFFALQAIIGVTRSGTLDEVWFVGGGSARRLLARDRIAVGSERSHRWRYRLALMDLATGERLARRKVDAPLELVGETPEALWFRRQDGADLHPRSPDTLERIALEIPPPAPSRRATIDPVLRTGTLPDNTRLAPPSADSFFLAEGGTGVPITWADPPSALAVSPAEDGLLLSRIASDGRRVWRAPLRHQRAIRAATRVGEVVVVITSGVARDFAVALDARTGETRWVHYF